MLFDHALIGAIERIGYLGTHKGAFLDHIYAYVDFNGAVFQRGDQSTGGYSLKGSYGRIDR